MCLTLTDAITDTPNPDIEMSKFAELLLESGEVYDVVEFGKVEELERQLAEAVVGGSDAVPPEGFVHENFPGLHLRGGYHRFECKTNARNYFWFDAPAKTPNLRASVHSMAMLFADPDGDGPDKPVVTLSFVTPEGEVIAEGMGGRIQFPDVAPGRYALCITVRYSKSQSDLVVTLYPA